MFIPAHDCHHRSAIKAVSWRALGSLDTFVLSYFITGSFVFAGSIASAETFTKVFLYYLHERAWSSLSWGCRAEPQAGQPLSAWARWSTASTAACARVLALGASFARPREFAATAALLVCFAAVVTPPSYLQNWAVPPTLSEWAPSPIVRGEVIEATRAVAVASPPVAMPARFDEAKANHRLDEQSEAADAAAHVTVAEVRADEPAETPHLTFAEQVPLPLSAHEICRALITPKGSSRNLLGSVSSPAPPLAYGDPGRETPYEHSRKLMILAQTIFGMSRPKIVCSVRQRSHPGISSGFGLQTSVRAPLAPIGRALFPQ